MLQEGKVSVDEAMALLRQVPDEEAIRGVIIHKNDHDDECDCDGDDDDCCTTNNNNNNRNKSANYGFSDIGSTIRNALSDALDAVDDVDININLSNMFGVSRNKTIVTYTSDRIASDINSLKILGKNAPVEIEGYDGDTIQMEIKYSGKRDNAQVHVNEENGNYELLYDYNAVRSLSVECRVPRVFIGHLHGESKNSKVELHNVNAGDVELLTKNSKIEIAGVSANAITAKTSNSKIEMENTKAKVARLTTSNSKIETENIDVEQLYLKTSNSGIKIENAFGTNPSETHHSTTNSQYPPSDFRASSLASKPGTAAIERIIEATTSNGGVDVSIPQGTAVKLQASTSNARCECKLSDLVVSEISKNYVSGKSINYDTATNRVKLNINTSNATVKIKEV